MRIQIKTKNDTIPAELLRPICSPALKETVYGDRVEVSCGPALLGTVRYNPEGTQSISGYCDSCGCEPYAEWPDYGYSFYTETNYDKPFFNQDFTWKYRVDAFLTPYFRKEEIQKAFDKKVKEEKSEIYQMPCPVCGGKLDFGLFSLFGKNTNKEMLGSCEKLEAFVKNCDTQLAININGEARVSIRSDLEKLKDYLLKIISVEKNISSIKQRLLLLYCLSYEVNRQAKFAQLYPIMSEKQEITNAIDAMQSELREKEREVSELQKYRDSLHLKSLAYPTVSMPLKPVEPIKPFYVTPKFYNRKKVTAENEAKAEKYNTEVARYNKALVEYPTILELAIQQQEDLRVKAVQEREEVLLALDEQIAKLTLLKTLKQIEVQKQQTAFESKLSQLQSKTDYPAVQLKINLDNEIATAEEILSNLFKQKNQLYGAEIIFGKYRDLVAITCFYEYLLSGRCETLDGANGCYNLYEAELRANIIINKLEVIGNSLEVIKDNQYMLYSQLSQINTELSILNATTQAMLDGVQNTAEVFLKQNEVIAHNSAVSAYYSKINAEIASSDRYISMICW